MGHLLGRFALLYCIVRIGALPQNILRKFNWFWSSKSEVYYCGNDIRQFNTLNSFLKHTFLIAFKVVLWRWCSTIQFEAIFVDFRDIVVFKIFPLFIFILIKTAFLFLQSGMNKFFEIQLNSCSCVSDCVYVHFLCSKREKPLTACFWRYG